MTPIEHTFVGNAGTVYGRLRTALNTGSCGLAKNIALEERGLTIDRAVWESG